MTRDPNDPNTWPINELHEYKAEHGDYPPGLKIPELPKMPTAVAAEKSMRRSSTGYSSDSPGTIPWETVSHVDPSLAQQIRELRRKDEELTASIARRNQTLAAERNEDRELLRKQTRLAESTRTISLWALFVAIAAAIVATAVALS